MESLESLYAQVSLCVPNGVCVVVHSAKYYVCAIACTTESKAMVFARQHDTAKVAEGRHAIGGVRRVSDHWTMEERDRLPRSNKRREGYCSPCSRAACEAEQSEREQGQWRADDDVDRHDEAHYDLWPCLRRHPPHSNTTPHCDNDFVSFFPSLSQFFTAAEADGGRPRGRGRHRLAYGGLTGSSTESSSSSRGC
ncbi:putative fatty acyl CoA synthetase 2 [Leishmania major strain Friedlin]|uniref:Putative fatty acyl CoA synthetase 2 n=1 Tax=Leishmania major TaxID=5664 RepID=E9AC42_LEIMA|nr:putative fatty acyl CoA synthetase 2 [Leishmania major strain Friedlin]CAG9567116.1 fatty_acyl_CoA_synthetase_2_-_putative [Leishmania major strain Friedlin]CBZ11856.1 putative fatty acyl CoA synthetase 2 [Leishmania major strain Friedlin]|eukprot:XP_003721573.1 putative fatty acyl CoA synthetase 2 [Leishmania major strain Friedlin]